MSKAKTAKKAVGKNTGRSATTRAAKTKKASTLPAPAVPKTLSLASNAWPEGFGETPADEEAFRRGFPHLRSLTQAAVADPVELTGRALFATEPMLDFEWPREVAERLVRGFAAGDPKYGAANPNDPAATAALRARGSMGNPRDLLRKAMSRKMNHRDWQIDDYVFLIEAEFGSDRTADAILTILEEGGKSLYANEDDPVEIAFRLGFLIGRAEDSAGLHARLITLRQKLAKAKPAQDWIEAIDTVLDGNRAFEYFGWRLGAYVYATDATALAQKVTAAPGDFIPDVRHAYLGGAPVLAMYARRIEEMEEDGYARRFFHQLARVKRSLVTPLMTQLAKRPDTGELAKRWLDEG